MHVNVFHIGSHIHLFIFKYGIVGEHVYRLLNYNCLQRQAQCVLFALCSYVAMWYTVYLSIWAIKLNNQLQCTGFIG